MKKSDFSLVCAYDSDFEKFKKLSKEELLEVTIKTNRNLGHHRKFFALMNLVFQNQEHFDDLTSLRYYITMKCGFFDSVTTKTGTAFLPKSIAFESMTQEEFAELYDKALDVILIEFGMDSESISDHIHDFY
jgi:hypothetical protein